MSDAVLRLEGLRKQFKGKEVLKGIDVAAGVGEVIGLIGLNGAGKTTVLECALGICPPSAGTARLFGADSASALDAATKARVGFVPQRDELLEALSGARYLDLIAGFYPTWNQDLIERLGREWDVPFNERIQGLSVGQRQKLSIIAALGHEPELIVLDEPVASLDPLARRRFLTELVALASSQDRTILFSTHLVADLERVASRVWLLQDGQLTVDEDLDRLKEHSVRVHLPVTRRVDPARLGAPLLRARQDALGQVLVFRDWNIQRQQTLEALCGSAFEVERLSLEDIFLELHA